MTGQEYSDYPPSGQEPPGASPCPGAPAAAPASHRSGPTWRPFLGGVLCLLVSCGPPRPPEELLEVLGATLVNSTAPSRGLSYFHLRNAEEPWAVHLIGMDLGECELGLQILEAPVSDGSGGGRSTVSELVASAGDEVLAAVNGDFFTPEGLPVGPEVVGGEVRQIRSRPALAWRPGQAPWMGVPMALGDSVVRLGWDLPRAAGDEATQVVGGFPLLLHEGGAVGDLEVGERPSFAASRHPRTAVGYDADLDMLWVLVVDGRQPEHSDGMTLPELVSALGALGVEEALNLDGGGSSVMVLAGTAVNRPSDSGGERPVVNALAIRRDRAFCQRVR